MRLGVGDAFVEQPSVQFVKIFEPQSRREEPLAHEPNLVLDLALLPTRSRSAGDRVYQVMAAHLQETAIVDAVLADEDCLHRRLHVVVDAALAGAPEHGECPVVRVEHHLLRLARIGADEQHAAVTEPDMGGLYGHRHAVQQDDLVAPDPMGDDSDRRSGKVRLQTATLETTMPTIADRTEEPTAIQTNLGAIFTSLELSHSIWLITSLSPGGGEKMSKHSVPAGDIASLLARFSELKQKALARTGTPFRSSFFRKRVSTASGFIAYCKAKESKATSSIPPRLRRHVGGDAPRPTGSTARRSFARYWRSSVANLACARWSRRQLPRKKIGVVSAASAKC